jgi:hypothetical protein
MKTLHVKIIYGAIWILTVSILLLWSLELSNLYLNIYIMGGICTLLYLFSGFLFTHKKEEIVFNDIIKYILTEKFLTACLILLAGFFFYVGFTE